MNILITGNLGYVGPVVLRHLRTVFPNAKLVGFDTGYFAHCLTNAREFPERLADAQLWGDIRSIDQSVLEGMDAVVQLSAISNDPMGSRFEVVTDQINFEATRNLAELAKRAGVKRFVFASSCSMYGFAEGGPRKETDDLNPLTAYARSKVASEKALAPLAGDDFIVTALRFSTACGMSPRLRLDLVLNDFVACAYAAKEITVLSDGSPWRPLIDVKDMARAIEWALVRDTKTTNGTFLAVNVGADEWNYQVKDLADAVAKEMPGTNVSINTSAPPDKRSYRVDFALYRKLAPKHQPQVTLQQAIRELKEGLSEMNFDDKNFRASQFMRLKVLERHMAEGRLREDLRWQR
jgi:nucleoside-diphosphate-sugar epimerase